MQYKILESETILGEQKLELRKNDELSNHEFEVQDVIFDPEREGILPEFWREYLRVNAVIREKLGISPDFPHPVIYLTDSYTIRTSEGKDPNTDSAPFAAAGPPQFEIFINLTRVIEYSPTGDWVEAFKDPRFFAVLEEEIIHVYSLVEIPEDQQDIEGSLKYRVGFVNEHTEKRESLWMSPYSNTLKIRRCIVEKVENPEKGAAEIAPIGTFLVEAYTILIKSLIIEDITRGYKNWMIGVVEGEDAKRFQFMRIKEALNVFDSNGNSKFIARRLFKIMTQNDLSELESLRMLLVKRLQKKAFEDKKIFIEMVVELLGYTRKFIEGNLTDEDTMHMLKNYYYLARAIPTNTDYDIRPFNGASVADVVKYLNLPEA